MRIDKIWSHVVLFASLIVTFIAFFGEAMAQFQRIPDDDSGAYDAESIVQRPPATPLQYYGNWDDLVNWPTKRYASALRFGKRSEALLNDMMDMPDTMARNARYSGWTSQVRFG